MKKKLLIMLTALIMLMAFIPAKTQAEVINNQRYELFARVNSTGMGPLFFAGDTISKDKFLVGYRSTDTGDMEYLPESAFEITDIRCIGLHEQGDRLSAIEGMTVKYAGDYMVNFELNEEYVNADKFINSRFSASVMVYSQRQELKGFQVITSREGFLFKWDSVAYTSNYKLYIIFDELDEDGKCCRLTTVESENVSSSETSYNWTGLIEAFNENVSKIDHVHFYMMAFNEDGESHAYARALREDSINDILAALRSTSNEDTTPVHTHTYPGTWTITQNPTVFAAGSQIQVCSSCGGAPIYSSIPKLTPTIKLSFAKKTLKKKKSAKLAIGGMAAGDQVVSVKSSNKKIVKVKKSKANNYKLTAVKKGKATITVCLASGKTEKCKVTVK